MFYRVVVDLLQPYTLLVIGLFASSVAAWRAAPARSRPVRLAAVLSGLLWLVSTPIVGQLAAWSLERSYRPLQGFPEDVEAIVILGGSMRVYDDPRQKAELAVDTALRVMHGAQLYHRAGRKLILASGGPATPDVPTPTLARAIGDLLLQLGINPADLLLEDTSRTTYENAICCHRLLAKRNIRRIVLVTDATHMCRASRCFRAAGFLVVPAACNYKAARFRLTPDKFLPSSGAAANLASAVHEWLGLVWYWCHGRL